MNFILLILFAAMYQYSFSVDAAKIHGRYTKSLKHYNVAIPHKLTADGEFLTYHLPHFHEHRTESLRKREKRTLNDPEMVRYGVSIKGDLYHMLLWPNVKFLDPNLMLEKRDPTVEIKDRQVRALGNKKLCFYTGKIKGIRNSKVALSTCDGLAGHIVINGKKYFIEPVDQHVPNEDGHHLHVLHVQRPKEKKSFCGVDESWEEAIKKRFRERALEGHDILKEKRSFQNVHRYIETTVVCDKKFLQYHKDRDTELYVMTVMNMAADLYHDESVGQLIDLVVVRIIYLEKEEEEIDLVIDTDAPKTLISFCNWTLKINTPMESPNHHDIAMLLTRYDICGGGDVGTDCSVTGLATLGAVCSKTEPCGIVEDSGMVLASTMAHEIGHLLGAQHDSTQTSCPNQDVTDGSFFVMSLVTDSYIVRWSNCSRALIGALLEQNLGECLNDIPESTLYPYSDNLPGVVYDASEQCKHIYPNATGLCPGLEKKVCESVVCLVNKEKGQCIGKHQRGADGTKCGNNMYNPVKVAIRSFFLGGWYANSKKCIDMGTRLEAVNGGWGEWGPWSTCSRTCGGGVTIKLRECNKPLPANRGRYCLGEKRQIKTCSSEPCPEGSPTYRQQQCTDHDKVPRNGELHTWTAHIVKDKPCVLFCKSEEGIIAQLEPVAKDGTRCRPGTKDMCILGTCTVIGCDNAFESKAVEDRCGICNGDGTQCKIVEGNYTALGKRYAKVILIPAGARKIVIEEKAPSSNILAISDSTKKTFYLNGNYSEARDGEYPMGKAKGYYTHVERLKEKLIISGPLKEDILFMVLFVKDENVGYSYKWSEPTTDSTYEPSFHWEIGEYGECSALCGGGTQTATLNCMEEKAGKVASTFCEERDKPKDATKNCNEPACAKRWKVGPWGRCRACKKKGGVQVRPIECVKQNPKRGADDTIIEDSECEDPKPGTVQLCKTTKKCSKKRMSSYIPGKYQNKIWSQMNLKRIRKENKMPDSTQSAKTTDDISSTKPRPNTTRVVVDVPPNDQVIEIFTVAINPKQTNISDDVNMKMGDEVEDNVSIGNKTILTGREATLMELKLENPLNEKFTNSSKKKKDKKKG